MTLYNSRHLNVQLEYLTRTQQQLLFAEEEGTSALHAPNNQLVIDNIIYQLPKTDLSGMWMARDGEFHSNLDRTERVFGVLEDVRYASLQVFRVTNGSTMLDVLNRYCREPLDRLYQTFSYEMDLRYGEIVMEYDFGNAIDEDRSYTVINSADVLDDVLNSTIQGDLILIKDDWIRLDEEDVQLGSLIRDIDFIAKDLRVSPYQSDISAMWR